MYTRNCPQCGRELTYKQKGQVTEANKKNRKCSSCARKKIGFNTECAYCHKPIYRRPCRTYTRNYCSHACRNKFLSKEKSPLWKGGRSISRQKDIQRQKENRRILKQMGVDYLGGKCRNCGYDKCIAALDFHHTDPNTKDEVFPKKCELTWEKMKETIKNCILLCANCHREHHYINGK